MPRADIGQTEGGAVRRAHVVRCAIIGLLALAFGTTTARGQIPASAYPARRAAAIARIGGDVLIAPARGSFLADDQLGFVQAADFQYLTGLDELVGAVLVLDGTTSTAMLFVAPRNPLLTRGVFAPDAEWARRLQLSSVQPIDALEPWLQQRFSATAPTCSSHPSMLAVRSTAAAGRHQTATAWRHGCVDAVPVADGRQLEPFPRWASTNRPAAQFVSDERG